MISIEDGAFYGCSSLGNITIPERVTNIERDAFYGCNSLKNITIPDSMTSIGIGILYNCTSLSEIITPSGSYAEIWAMEHSYQSIIQNP